MARSIQHAYISVFVGILASLLAVNSAQSQSQCSPSRNPSFNVISDTCVNQAVSFRNNTPASSSVSYYTWQFGTGDSTRIDTNTNVQYTYSTADTFNVKLIAADTSGSTNCRDTLSKQVRISGYPSADFTMQKTPICSGNQQQFTNNSSGSGLSHSWDFGDGSNSTNKNPSNTYTYTGSGYGKITNQIKLVITNNSGCQDSITKSLNVSSNPTAGFNYASDTVCSGAVQSFTNTSNGVSLSYSYAFGDGSSSSGSSPTHIYKYTGSGYKNVTTTLTVTNSSGCQNSTSKTFSVGRKPDPAFAPTTSFDNCTGKGDTFRATLYDNSTPSAISNYKVYWGDNSDTSLSSKPSKLDHTYPQKNIYEVTIEITNNNGCVDSADKDVLNIRNPAVGVSSPGNTQKCDTVDVSFPINNADSNFSTTNYTVTYGDGESGSYNHPPPDSVRHVYTANSCLEPNEDFVFEVKASNACASTKATVNSVKVFQSPVADFKPLPDTVCVNTSVKFSNNSTKPYNKSNCDNAGKYSWNFGDTSSQSSFAKQDVNHTYTSTGTFRPNLSITQVSCNASYDTNEVCVIPKPTASFTIDTAKGCQPLTVSATNTSNTLNACAASTYTWSVNKNSGWSFTNSTNQNSQDATFQFTQPGKYIITLKDSNKCRKDTYRDTVTIQDRPSLAITNPGDFCESASFVPNTATFDSNFAKLTQNKWNFPGGTPASANQINPDTVNFSGAGTYELNASFANRCGTSYDTVKFQIYQNPNVQTGNDTLICYNDPIALGDTVTGGKPGYTYQWQPAGKVGGDSLLKPTVSLTDTTTFTLKATDSRSCVGRDSIKVEVNPQINPNAGSDQFICYDSTTQLNGSSTGGVTPYQYNWSPAGKLSSTSGASVTTANLIQNQTFTLTVTDSNNCSASNSVNVDVNNQLSVSATVKQDTLCYNDSTTLQSSYSGGSDSLTVSWSPASKVQNAAAPNPTTTGLQNTTDFVLTVTDSLGCRKRDTVTITVSPDITISTEADTAICFDDSLQLNASTSGGLGSLSYQWSPGGKVQKPKTLTPYTTPLTSDKTFTLTATDQFSCLSKASVQVTVDTALTANAGTDDTYCGDTLRLGGNPVASGGTRPFTYRWTPSQPMVDTTLANAGVTTLDSVTRFNVLVTDSFGCTASDRVKVYPKPKADAGPDTTFCASSLKIGGNPTGSGGDSSLTYSWTPSAKLNDTTLANPEIPSLSQPDTFVVRVTDGNNCSVRDSVTVFEPLQADAGPDSTLCSDSLLIGGSPAATGGEKPYTYSWSGSSALQQTNTANPAVKGLSRTDTFVLSVTDQSGCQRRDTVIIHPPVQVSTGPDTTYCGSGSLTIGNANPASGGKDPFTYSWTPSSNLNNANQAQPDVTSLSKQTDFVLTATDQFSCQATDTLTVYPPVQAEAGANETFCDSSITLGGRRVGRGGKPGYQYQWQPAAKLSNDSIANPKLDSLDKQTTFSVSVTGQKGCTKKDSVTIYPPVEVNLDTFSSICRGDSIQVNSLSVSGGKPGFTYSWSPTDSVSNPAIDSPRLYPDSTTRYTITVTDSLGCAASKQKRVAVNPLPNAAFSSTNTCFGDTTQFTDQSSVSQGSIDSFQWDFGTGDTAQSQNPSYYFDSSQSYSVSLSVKTDSGCIDSIKNSVSIASAPQASFKANNACRYDSIAFTNTSNLSCDSVKNFDYEFGDGDTADLANPSHQYNSAGTYQVTLTITTANQVVDSVKDSVVVHPVPDPAFSVQNVCAYDSSRFQDNSSISGGSIASYDWDFGDGSSSNNQNPVHKYSTADSFTVSLTTTSDSGCKDTISKNTNVHPVPSAQYQVPDTVCFGDTASFTDQSTITSGKIDSFRWDFGDGDSAFTQSPDHYYDTSRTFNNQLVTISDSGCRDTASQSTTIRDEPQAAFTASNACRYDTISFTNTSNLSCDSVKDFDYEFGDGDSADRANPSHQYSSAGTYQVTLTITTANQVVDSVKDSVVVHPVPDPAFSVQNVCAYDSSRFQDQSSISSGSIRNYQWDFGDGSSSNNQNPVHKYSTADSFTVSLTTTSDSSCKDTVSKTTDIHPVPTAQYQVADTVCFGDTASFTDQSTITSGKIDSFRWDFGDGDSAFTQSPDHYYDTSRTFNHQLVTISDSGCFDTANQKTTVRDEPQADFKANNACRYDSITFTNTSNLSCDSVKDFDYEFGDGDTADLANPVHQYSSAGTYQVTLTITTANQVVDSVKDSVVVHPVPKPDFSVRNVCAYDSSRFQDNSSISGGSIASYDWDFGDGSSSNSQNPVHKYSTADSFTVSLTTTSDSGCKDTVSKNTFIHPVPTAQYQVADTVCFGDTASFTDQSTITSGKIDSFRWDFGDGDTALSRNPSHYYDTSRTFNHQLVTISDSGCFDTANQKTTVRDEPQADFKANNACRYDSITFTNTSNLSCDSVKDFDYEFGDGDSADRANPSHQYSSAGTYQVTLTITTANQVVDSVKDSVVVHPVPDPAFSVQNVCAYDSSRFQDQSSISSGSIRNYQWDFGDGSSSNNQNPVHKYSTADSFTVSLTTTSDSGCKDTISQATDIHPVPTAQYQVADTVCFGDTASFTDQSTIGSGGSLDSFQWDFGDGDTALTQNPDHYYDTSLTFNHQLVTVSDSGCFDTATDQTTIRDEPQANFTASNACRYDTISFTNTSNLSCDSVKDFDYEFGDGDTADRANPSHQYSSAGTYQVTLTITTANQVVDSVKDSVVVHPVPDPAFSVQNVCAYDSSRFQDNSSISGGSIASYDWDFGDGSSSNNQNPVHKYSTADSFTVSLTTTSDSGCKDTISQATDIHPVPTAQYQVPDTVCFGDTTSFTDQSTIGSGGGLNSFRWDFGDGDTALTQNPDHYYDTSLTFNNELIVASDSGCRDTATDQTTIRDEPEANFTASNACRYDTISFTNTSNLSCDSVKDFDYEFGDGDSADRANPVHQYSSAGTYQVTLTITTANQVVDSVKDSVVVHPVPKPDFSVQNVCAYDSSRFQNQSSISGGSIASYNWDFGDGNSSNNQNPVYKYGTADSFTVSLTTTSDSGCKATISQATDIHPVPTAQYQVPDTVCFGDTASFTDQSTIGSGGGLDSFQWDFGDGDSAFTQNPDHYYDTGRQFNHQLQVISDSGCRDTASKQTRVLDGPQAAMSFTNRCVNKTVSFQDQSTISCDSIIRHRWTFGDGSTASKANPDHTYTQPGQYRIKLVITLGNGAQDSTTRSIDIHPEPVAAFRTQNICKGDTAAFSSQSRISKGAITNYQWDFGDSSQGSGISPDHYYQQFGTYQTQLTVTSDSGCVDSTTQKLVVNPTPQPAFSSTRPCFGDTTRFSDSSTIGKGAITQYQWQFGDGDSSLLQNPAHFYQQPGVYNTNLTVTSDSGCRASRTKQARVDSLPRVSFSIDSLICKNQSYNLTNNSTIADSFQWQFGDGRTFNSKTPNHIYQDTGSYEVKLVAFNNYGCAYSFSRQVRVIQKPDVSFSTNKDSFCGPTANVVFSNFSTGYQPSYQWDLGNGQQRNQQFIDTIDYAQNNDTDTTYYITLTATNQCGVVQQRDSINVFPAPISRFTMSQDQGCSPVKVQFKDSATGLPDTYLWQFASDDTSQRPEPRHAFRTGTSDTTYGIRQITTNRCGRDTAIDSVTVFPNTIDAIFQVDTTLGCQPLTVDFQNLSSAGATRFSWQFGDGDISNKASPNHTYTSADTFSVSMVATNGCSYDTFRNTIRTFPKPDVQGQVSKPEACAKEDFELRNQTSDVSSVLWLYNNGSDTLSTQPNATVSLDSAGQRIITQKVRSVAYDCPAKQQDTIRIQPLPSIAISLDTSSGCPPLRVAFSNDAGNVVSRLWEFGDGKQAIAANPVHTYRNTGNYTASLEATTDKSCTDSGSTEINVFPSPDAQFSTTPDSACGPPAESKLTDQSTGATLSRWNLPEGRQSDSSTLTVRLDSVGDYPIELVSRNRFGCRDTANQSFTVYPAPKAGFEALNARRACVPHAVNLSSQAVNTDKTYWSLDGSLLDSGRQTTVEVKPTIKSDVRMVAIGAGGCQDTLIKADWLEGYPRPEARFDYQPLRDPEARGKFQFEDASRGAARVRWSFGDGTGSMKPDPVHRYPGNGTYKPELVATTDRGCKDTATQTLQPDFFSGLQVPNAIKPNSSKPGVRTFKPKGVGLESYHIGIYTKWGELVWESSELQDGAPAEAWDGTYQNGELCPQGSYVWKVKAQFKDGTQWQGQETETGDYKTIGTVTLIR